ncbi:MAG: Trk family potassium uptake protein [Lachnospiraceae bacterium]|nr:Trk family potassium uptake protein [Lachnospiraceae bacterium]
MKKTKFKLTPFQIIILGFAGTILIGALLLMLPIASKAGVVTPFNKTLFTSTSAVCVTGLVLLDTATYWSLFGQIVILILIQVGGLGVVTVASVIVMLAGGKISLMQRQTMQNALSVPQLGGVVKLTRFIVVSVFVVELIGALLLLPVFCTKYGAEGIWMSIFHSISAFCNAGFDVMGSKTGEFSSLTSFQGDVYLNLVITFLIVIGGIGFLTWDDIVTKRFKSRAYKMQSKVIIVTSLALILFPFLLFFFSDFADYPMKNRFCAALFQSVTTRTAGFNTADFSEMNSSGRAVVMMLMMVGGSPGSTAGGMKTTTIAILCANVFAVFMKRDNVHFFGRRIEDSVIKNAATILFMYAFLSLSGSFIISSVENLPLDMCLFETMSAIGTAGLTRGITSGLGILSQTILIILMFLGRVGGLTLIYAAFSRRDNYTSKYPVENIMVG